MQQKAMSRRAELGMAGMEAENINGILLFYSFNSPWISSNTHVIS